MIRAMGRESGGFTLVEMLIALTLMGLILTTLFSGLFGTSRMWSRSEAQAEENDAARIGFALLRRLLSETVPILRLDGREPALLFQGDKDTLRWVAPLPSHAGGTGLYWVSLNLKVMALGNSDLVLTYIPLRPEAPPSAAAFESDTESVVISDNVVRMEIAYYGATEEDLPSRWHDNWSAVNHMPEAVRITLARPTGETAWPPLVVPLRVPAQRSQVQWTIVAPQTPA